MADLQPVYDDAKVNIEQYRIDLDLINDEQMKVNQEMWRIDAMINQLDQVLWALQNQLWNIENSIGDLEEWIEDLEYDISELEVMIAEQEINKEYAEGHVARLQQLLAITEVKITEGEAIVAHWKAMLDEAIAEAGE
jgi:chromosome segregation ATPase